MDPFQTINQLKKRGYKITETRKAIIDIFSKSKKPLSASYLNKALCVNKIKVNKTTIYRQLQFMVDNNLLKEVYLQPQEISYEPTKLKHHHHLICTNCGEIDNVSDCLANKLNSKILKTKGFKILSHSLEFYGICNHCK